MNLRIKSGTEETTGLTTWWLEDEYGGRLLTSPGFVDPVECQKHLDLTRQAFADDARERQQ